MHVSPSSKRKHKPAKDKKFRQLFVSARELGKLSPDAQKAIESMRAVRSNAGMEDVDPDKEALFNEVYDTQHIFQIF
jgi:hypothetical protein